MCFDGYSSLSAMYKGNPILTLLIFGLPLSFLSVILYSSCCSDILDAPEEIDSEIDEEGTSSRLLSFRFKRKWSIHVRLWSPWFQNKLILSILAHFWTILLESINWFHYFQKRPTRRLNSKTMLDPLCFTKNYWKHPLRTERDWI